MLRQKLAGMIASSAVLTISMIKVGDQLIYKFCGGLSTTCLRLMEEEVFQILANPQAVGLVFAGTLSIAVLVGGAIVGWRFHRAAANTQKEGEKT